MIPESPDSKAIGSLSPSSFEVIRACRTRMAFSQSYKGRHKSPALRLGDVCHRVLDHVIQMLELTSTEWVAELTASWDLEIDKEASLSEKAGERDLYGPPSSWPGYEVKRARLFKMAQRLRQDLADVPREALITEEWLSARDGALRGRADLLVRTSGRHEVIDYKSGRVIEKQTMDVRSSYERQLQIYALLEHEDFGAWPAVARLFPLEGPPVEVSIESAECDALGDEAIELIEDFNRIAPGKQPANVSEQTCPECSFASRCAPFWERFDADWAQTCLGVRGRVQEISKSPLGGTSLLLDVMGGSIDSDKVLIRNIKPHEHPEIELAHPTALVHLVGLRPERNRESFALPLFGRMSVSSETKGLV